MSTKSKQRKGQWLINEIYKKIITPNDDPNGQVVNSLFYLSDKEFDAIFQAKEKAEYKPIEICPKHHRVLDDRKHCRDCDSQ